MPPSQENRIDVFHHFGDHHAIHVKLDLITDLLRRILHLEVQQVADIEALTAEVAETQEVEQSAIVLIQNLAQMVRDLEPTQEAIDALASQLDGSQAALAAAVATAPTP
jgi:hypothetical protein